MYHSFVMSFRLKQMGMALCLMASLLIGHALACTCSHHEENEAAETDCHSHHDSSGNIEISETGNSVDDSCICVVEQPSPYVTSKSASKELKSNNPVAGSGQLVPDLEFVAVIGRGESTSVFANDLSYSNTLKSLLPSRAPPRL